MIQTLINRELPEEKELVLIKINKIVPHGAYCGLIEYKLDAYLPISEIASGWIKNIHEFIKEGQKSVAKVISVDKEKRTVDISLKKTNNKERTDKINEYNLEKRSEKLFNQAIINSKNEQNREAIIKELSKKITTYYELTSKTYSDKTFTDFLKNPKFSEAISEIVIKNTKPKRYEVSYTMELTASSGDVGMPLIKKICSEIEEAGVKILYLGAPHYRLTSEDANYPKAEGRIREAERILDRYSKSLNFSIKNTKG